MLRQRPDVPRNVHHGVTLQVPHAKAAAQIQCLGHKAVGLAHRLGKVQQNIDRIAERLCLKDLGTDVAVEALNDQVLPAQRVGNEPRRLPRLDGHTELAVDASGVDGLQGMGVDARRHPQQHPLADAPHPGGLVQPGQLLVVVHDEAPHVAVQGIGNVLVGLVVPVEVELLRREPTGQGRVDLARRDHICPHPLLVQHGVEALKAQGLSGKQGVRALRHILPERLDIGPAVLPQLVLVQDVQGGAKFLGQGHGVQAAHGQVALFVHSQVIIQHRSVPVFLVLYLYKVSQSYLTDPADRPCGRSQPAGPPGSLPPSALPRQTAPGHGPGASG